MYDIEITDAVSPCPMTRELLGHTQEERPEMNRNKDIKEEVG